MYPRYPTVFTSYGFIPTHVHILRCIYYALLFFWLKKEAESLSEVYCVHFSLSHMAIDCFSSLVEEPFSLFAGTQLPNDESLNRHDKLWSGAAIHRKSLHTP